MHIGRLFFYKKKCRREGKFQLCRTHFPSYEWGSLNRSGLNRGLRQLSESTFGQTCNSSLYCDFNRSLYHGNDDFGYVEYDRDEADEIITINRAFENSDRETNRVNHQRARSEEVDVVEEESEDQVGSEPKQYARPTDSYYDVSIVIGIAISAVFFVIVGTG